MDFPCPKNFDDMIYIKGLIHGAGVWDAEAKECMMNHAIPASFMPAFRVDVFEWMVGMGVILKDAWRAAEFVRHEYGLPFTPDKPYTDWDQWTIKRCRKILYMVLKGRIIEYLLLKMKAGRI